MFRLYRYKWWSVPLFLLFPSGCYKNPGFSPLFLYSQNPSDIWKSDSGSQNPRIQASADYCHRKQSRSLSWMSSALSDHLLSYSSEMPLQMHRYQSSSNFQACSAAGFPHFPWQPAWRSRFFLWSEWRSDSLPKWSVSQAHPKLLGYKFPLPLPCNFPLSHLTGSPADPYRSPRKARSSDAVFHLLWQGSSENNLPFWSDLLFHSPQHMPDNYSPVLLSVFSAGQK